MCNLRNIARIEFYRDRGQQEPGAHSYNPIVRVVAFHNKGREVPDPTRFSGHALAGAEGEISRFIKEHGEIEYEFWDTATHPPTRMATLDQWLR